MRLFIALLILISSSFAFAGDVVLLTSLKLNKLNVRHLEKKFKKAFDKSGHEIVIHHKADPKALYQVMTSDETVAVIWVSHAAGESELKPGFKAEDIVLDIWGNDVKNFFTLVPKNLKFLGLVGCQAQKIIDGFRARGNYDTRPDLEIMSFEKKVRLYNAFDKTVKAASASINGVDENADDTIIPNIDFNIDRVAYEESPTLQAGWVEIGDQVLAFFDVNQTSAIGAINETLFSKIERKNMKFFRAKSATSVDESLGKLQISAIQKVGSWNLFAKDGRPIGGRDQQLYVFKKP